MAHTEQLSEQAQSVVKHGVLATWWDATSEPSYLAASLAKGEPRVHPVVFAVVALATSAGIAVAVTHVQLTYELETFGALDTISFFERAAFADLAVNLGLNLLTMLLAAWLFSFAAKLPLRQVLRTQAYTLGPISHLYAWWTLYRWLREVQPAARRPEAWALMSFTVEWGLGGVLAHYFGLSLREALLRFAPLG